MQRFGAVRGLLLHNSLTRGACEPGLSEIGLTLVVDDIVDARDEFDVLDAAQSEYRRAKQWFPMLGDLEVLSARTLAATTRFGIIGYDSRYWRPVFGTVPATLGFRPSEERFRFEACNHAWFNCIDVVQQRMIDQNAASGIALRELRRVADEVLVHAALARGSERPDAVLARHASPAEIAAITLGALDAAVRARDSDRLWADPSTATAIDGAQSEVRRAEGPRLAWPPPVAGVATIVVTDSTWIVVVDDGLGCAALRACLEWTATAFATRDRPVRVVTPAAFEHWIRCFDPYLYTQLIRYGRVVWGKALRLPSAPAERSFAHGLLAQAHHVIAVARSPALFGPDTADYIAGREIEMTIERGARLLLVQERGSVSPWYDELAATSRRAHDVLFTRLDAIRVIATGNVRAGAFAAFELLRSLADDVAEGIERAPIDTLLFRETGAPLSSQAATRSVARTPSLPATAADVDVSDRNWDWPKPMSDVATRFRGQEGVVVQLGDSLTLARPNQQWAMKGLGHTAAERAFLDWAHAGRRDARNGWYLASTRPDPSAERPHAHTASIGCSAFNLLTGKGGRTPLAQMISTYRPQIAMYAVGASDILRFTPLEDYLADVGKALDLLCAAGSVPVLLTLAPLSGHLPRVMETNAALRALARARCIPLLDIYTEMARRQTDPLDYLDADGIHLTAEPSRGPATPENLVQSGYLLRCYLTVHKAMEVRERVLRAVPLPALGD
jgi:lysophospholipase L1-like esterase